MPAGNRVWYPWPPQMIRDPGAEGSVHPGDADLDPGAAWTLPQTDAGHPPAGDGFGDAEQPARRVGRPLGAQLWRNQMAQQAGRRADGRGGEKTRTPWASRRCTMFWRRGRVSLAVHLEPGLYAAAGTGRPGQLPRPGRQAAARGLWLPPPCFCTVCDQALSANGADGHIFRWCTSATPMTPAPIEAALLRACWSRNRAGAICSITGLTDHARGNRRGVSSRTRSCTPWIRSSGAAAPVPRRSRTTASAGRRALLPMT
ncbi:hypothetical protein RKD29_000023 [Streptomyces tendae]